MLIEVPAAGVVVVRRCVQYVSPLGLKYWSTCVWPLPSVLAVAPSQSTPTPQTQLFARVVVSEAVGAPVAALPVPTAPRVDSSAPVNAATFNVPCHDPELRVAVTTTLFSALGAAACQISAVPARVFVRWRSRQVSPPPLTELNDSAPLEGPSEARNATSSSPAWAVLIAGEAMLVPLVL